MAYDQRAVFADGIKFFRVIPENDPQRIGAFHPVHDLCHGLQGIALIIIIQQVGDHFRIRLGYKHIPVALQLLFQLQIIFNDPVVDHHDTLILVKMRVGIHIRRRTMGRPAGMADTKGSGKGLPAMSQFTKHFQPPLGLYHVNLFSIVNGDPRRIVASVFQFGKTVQKDGRSLFISDISDNSTHSCILLSFVQKADIFALLTVILTNRARSVKKKEDVFTPSFGKYFMHFYQRSLIQINDVYLEGIIRFHVSPFLFGLIA